MTATDPGGIEPAVLLAAMRANPDLASLLDRFAEFALPDPWIVAGAVVQAWWNRAHFLPGGHGVRDIDIVYFDPDDLSATAEEAHEARLRDLFPALRARLDVKNQARVHQWYGAKFGRDIAPYRSVAEAVATYPATATCIGVRPAAGGLAILAPHGTTDFANLVVRPNRVLVSRAVYEAKATRWAAAWSRLVVRSWSED